MSYATTDDLYRDGAPARSFGQTTTSDHQNALDKRTAWINSFLFGRYPDAVPLLQPYDPYIVWCNSVAAAFDLMHLRGYNPSSDGDKMIATRFAQAEAWLTGVQNQNKHPKITPPSSGPPAQRPLPRVSSGTPRGI